jgi:hypothetical protein
MVTLVFDADMADMLAGLGNVDLLDLVSQVETMLLAVGDMDLSEVRGMMEDMAAGADPASMMSKFEGADLSTLAGDLAADVDLDDLVASLDAIDLSQLGADPGMTASGGIESGMEKLTDMKAKYDKKMAEDPALQAYLGDFVHNLVPLLQSHQHDIDEGVSLQTDLEGFMEVAVHQYVEVEHFSDEDQEVLSDGLTALMEVAQLVFDDASENADPKKLAAWFAAYQAKAAAERAKEGLTDKWDSATGAARDWLWGQVEKSPAEAAVDELFPTPAPMTPYQTKQFNRVKAEMVVKYEAHPDFKAMTNQEKSRWQQKLLSEAQADMSTFLSSQQLKMWASRAYPIGPRGPGIRG